MTRLGLNSRSRLFQKNLENLIQEVSLIILEADQEWDTRDDEWKSGPTGIEWRDKTDRLRRTVGSLRLANNLLNQEPGKNSCQPKPTRLSEQSMPAVSGQDT